MLKPKKTKPFEQWTREEVEMTFGIKRNDDLPSLSVWLSTNYEISPTELAQFAEMQNGLRQDIDLYNEDELKFFFISQVMNAIKFKSTNYRAFTQRPMAFTTQTIDQQAITVSGVVELVVATGKQTPQKPFFFLQEFKQSLKRNNDPLGQLLIAMLGAQVKNNDDKPIYGCYVLGEKWHFVILDGKEYAASSGFDVTKSHEFEQMIRILKEQKKYIETSLNLI
jgi:hypothetical protein